MEQYTKNLMLKKYYEYLNYKFQTKELEDHIRIATKITDEHNENSCLLYINNSYAKEFLKSLNKVKQNQENIMKN